MRKAERDASSKRAADKKIVNLERQKAEKDATTRVEVEANLIINFWHR
jgi:hypothetical protein